MPVKVEFPTAEEYVYVRTNLTYNEKGKKKFCVLSKWSDKNFKDIYKQEAEKHKKSNSYALLTGEINKLFVIDFDDIEQYNKYINKYPALLNAYRVKTNKGYHLYFRDDRYYTMGNQLQNNIDFRGNGNMINAVNSKVGNEQKYFLDHKGVLDKVPDGVVEEILKEHEEIKNKNKKGKKNKNNNTENKNIEKPSSILDLIDIQFLDDFTAWRDIMWAMKREGYSKEEAITLSKKSKKFDEEGFNNIWEQSPDDIYFTKGTINYYARLSNEEEYFKFKGDNEEVLDKVYFNFIRGNETMSEELKKKLEDYDNKNKTTQRKIDMEVKEFQEKQIKSEFIRKKKYFEKFNFKINTPARFGKVSYDELIIMTKKDFLTQNEDLLLSNGKSFVEMWCKHLPRQYERLDFLPPPFVTPPHIFNTFRGFRASKLPEPEEPQDLTIFFKHINALVGNDKKSYDYFINYLGQLVQKPGTKPNISIVLRSDEGTGKNMFLENFGNYLLGNNYTFQTDTLDDAVGQFTSINDKIIIVLDEVTGKDSFSACEKIKNIITADKLRWEQKGINAIWVTNCGRYFILSNNSTPVKISPSDRRFVVFESSNEFKNNNKHFEDLLSAFKNDKMIKTFYNYLMSLDLSNFNLNDRPITEAYQDIQQASYPPFIHFVINTIDEYDNAKYNSKNEKLDEEQRDNHLYHMRAMEKQKPNELFQMFQFWKVNNGFEKTEMNITKLGRELTRLEGVEKKRTKSGFNYSFDFDKLKSHVSQKYKYSFEDDE